MARLALQHHGLSAAREHGACQLRIEGHAEAQGPRYRQDPLAHGDEGEDGIDEVRRRVDHAPPGARGAESSPMLCTT